MTSQPPTARFLVLTALTLALAGDLFLRVEPWGLNVTMLMLLLVTAIAVLGRVLHDPLPHEAWVIAGLGLLTAMCFAWRAAEGLTAFNFLGTIAAIHLLTARKHPEELPRMTFLDHLLHIFTQIFTLAAGFLLLLLRDLRGGSGENGEQQTRRGRVWLGLVLTIPAVLLFGALLTSADATFEYLITDVFQFDIRTLIGHAALIAFLSWIAGGWLRGRFLATEFPSTPALLPKRISLGAMETGILLGALDLLFVVFVALQIPHFFGGHDAIAGTPALTYAQYARRGFFELITVAALGLPLLLLVDWLFHSEATRERLLIRALSVGMVVLLGVMLASAMHRLSLYVEAYGLTASRVNAAAILVWIALTLLLFCATALRGKRHVLPYAIIVSGYIVLLGLNVLNPDALVARVNTARIATDGKFDTQYTFGLGADAVPVLIGALPAMTPEQQSALAEHLLRAFAETSSNQDIRGWNAARAAAESHVRAHEAELRGYVMPQGASAAPAH